MADNIDKFLEDYYSGRKHKLVSERIHEIETPDSYDENQGGGRAQNKQTRPVDDLIIRKDEDALLNELRSDLNYAMRVVGRIEKSFTPEMVNVVRLRFDKRLGNDWFSIEEQTGISARQGQRYVSWFKREVGNIIWHDKDKKTTENLILNKATTKELAAITELIRQRLSIPVENS